MFLKKSLLLVTVASLFFLGGGNCATPPVVPPSDAKPSDPVPDPTPDPIPIPSKISFSKIPVFLKSGDKIIATLENATGKETYAWTIDGQVDANQTTNTFNIAAIDSCDKVLDIGVSATDENGNVEKASKKIKVSKTWCTYTANSKALLSNNITKLAVAQNSTVWIGTDKGLNSFDGHIWTEKTSSNSVLRTNVITALLTNKNEPWVSTDGDGIWHLVDDALNFLTNDLENYFKSTHVYDLAFAANGDLLVGTKKGVAIVNSSTGKLEEYFSGQWITAIAVNSSAQWYGTAFGNVSYGEGLWLRHNESEIRIDGGQWWSGGTINTDVRTLALDGDNLYVGLNEYGRIITGNYVLGGMVRAIIKAYHEDKAPDANWKLNLASAEKNMPGNSIRKIVVGTNKSVQIKSTSVSRSPVWVATSEGLGRFSPEENANNNGTWESFKKGDAGVELPSNDITDLAYDKATDTLWIGTNGGGLTRLRVGIL